MLPDVSRTNRMFGAAAVLELPRKISLSSAIATWPARKASRKPLTLLRRRLFEIGFIGSEPRMFDAGAAYLAAAADTVMRVTVLSAGFMNTVRSRAGALFTLAANSAND